MGKLLAETGLFARMLQKNLSRTETGGEEEVRTIIADTAMDVFGSVLKSSQEIARAENKSGILGEIPSQETKSGTQSRSSSRFPSHPAESRREEALSSVAPSSAATPLLHGLGPGTVHSLVGGQPAEEDWLCGGPPPLDGLENFDIDMFDDMDFLRTGDLDHDLNGATTKENHTFSIP